MSEDAPNDAAGTAEAPPTSSRSLLSDNTFSRLTLMVVGAVWVGVGVLGAVHPVGSSEFLGIDLETTTALSDYRAVNGGLALALGVVHVVAALRAGWLRPGMWMAATLLVGLLGGRVTSLAIDGLPGPAAWALAGVEVVLLTLCVMALWRLGLRARS